MNLNELRKHARTLSLNELREFRRDVISVLEEASKEKTADLKHELGVGDVVKVNHRRLRNQYLTVVKVNRVKAKLKSKTNTIWTVPLSLIEQTDMVELEKGNLVG